MKVDFESLADALFKAAINENPSELHGLLCGRIAGGQKLSDDQCLAAVVEHFSEDGDKFAAISEQLLALYKLAYDKLRDTGFGFELLLPDDDYELAQRLDSLGLWCQGFLVGLGLSGLSSDTQFSADAADALKDLAQIAQIDAAELESDESETNFFEVTEYVRMAALMVHSEVNTTNTSKQPTIH
ncbi:UPF0149 family protein [bacterium SCSIO 12696]|nr:UPF0149 family protein [bacterium SCSIO 12696]